MPRYLLLAFGVAALSAAGGADIWAADLPLKAPPPMPAWTWNGVYLGGHAGYAWAHDPVHDQLFAGQSTPSVGDINARGVLGGFQAGANWQSGAWVTGLEFDISATAVRGSSSATGTGTVVIGSTGTETLAIGDTVDMLGSARARFGYLLRPDLLLYGTGGLAWARVDVSSNESLTGPSALVATSNTPTWRYGWVAGAGAEMRLADTNWLARVEYLHYDFGDASNSAVTTIGAGIPGSPAPGTSVQSEGPLTVDLVRAGLSYKFGGTGPAGASVGAGPFGWAASSTASWASPWTWSGLYVGAHGGYGWSRDRIDESFGSGGLHGVAGQGGLVGFQAGANWQRGPFVGGLEIDLSATHIRGQNSGSGTSVSGFATTTQSSTLGEEFRLLGSARTRIGYLVSPTTLLYATGGLAWTEINQSAVSDQTSAFPGPPATTTDIVSNASAPSWRFGWVAGVGAEQRIGATNWTGRLEYLHYDFGVTGSISSTVTALGTTTVSTLLTSNHMTADIVRVGANYRLGGGAGGAAPVRADAAPAPTSWDGFYLGVHGGGGFGNDPFDKADTIPVANVHASGWLAGGQAGANWQAGRWVAGLEIDASATGMQGSGSGTLVAAPGSFVSETVSDAFDVLGSARARLGWLPLPNLLVYGTGGLAWAQVLQGATSESSGAGFDSTLTQTVQVWRWGWAAGLGAEARIGHSHWLGRLEYLHYDFGRGSASAIAQFGSATVVNEGVLTADVFRAGLSYQLN